MSDDQETLPPITVYRADQAVPWPEALSDPRSLIVLDLEPDADSARYIRDWDQMIGAFDDTGPFSCWLVTPLNPSEKAVASWHGEVAHPGDHGRAWQVALGLPDGEGRGALVLDHTGTMRTRVGGQPDSDAVAWVRMALATQRIEPTE